MITVVLMAVMTVAAVFIMIETGRAGKVAAAEIVLCRAWSSRFAKQTLEEKKEEFLQKNSKYHTVSAKKAEKKVKEWDKQIASYQKTEELYLSGKRFSVLDIIVLFGYQLLVDIKLDGDNDLMRKLTLSCERTGYVELERDQETGDKKNSAIYAYYLLASLFAFLFVGVMAACFLGVVMIAAGNQGAGLMMPMAVGFVGPTLYGYVPYDNLQSKAAKRQEEIDRGFPNAISKIALLVTAGMNITRAIEETANSDNSLIYRELRLTVKEMNQAATVQGAFTRLQCRCNNKYLDKMITIVTKSYVAGNANLADDLRAINDECWLDKKHNARRMGEQIQNKLFIPTMLMFVGILVVIVVPAMSGLSL
ncbi:MAG: type II secretion system F family protein [bacterium]|nr:type II secretion system F family protein [bacterium]